MIENAIASLDQIDKASAALRADLEQLRTASAPPLAVVPAGETAETSTIPQPADTAAAPAPDAGVPDNSLPFKCPACGATYGDVGTGAPVCTNQHPPEQTLPTAAVLAGAEPTVPAEAAEIIAPAATPAPPDPSSPGSSTTPPATEPSAPAPATPGEPVPPSWPA